MTTDADALDAVSRVVDPEATEDELDLTARPVTWTAPDVEPAASSARRPTRRSPRVTPSAAPRKRSGTSILAAILGAGALVLVILLGAMIAVLWNRVSDLEDQVDASPSAVVEPGEAASRATSLDGLAAEVADLRATADALNAAQAGGATADELAVVTQRLDATIACINTYMDTIAQADNTGAPYVYAPC